MDLVDINPEKMLFHWQVKSKGDFRSLYLNDTTNKIEIS